MKATITVYLKYGGMKFFYDVEADTEEELTVKVREHAGAIWDAGYRHCTGKGSFEWFGPHWIDKIKATGPIQTSYPDRSGGT